MSGSVGRASRRIGGRATRCARSASLVCRAAFVHIERIEVRNFRLLREVELRFDAATTVIVGRNNSGKTSLADVLAKFLRDRSGFALHDFSSACYDGFCTALRALQEGKPDEDVRALRSEEHTSELQSLMRISHAVFCVKKKKFYSSR